MMTPIIQDYKENPARPGTFDLVRETNTLNISYFKLSTPRNERFKTQGAVIMIETWTRDEKPLFSGLVPLKGLENVLFGNRLEPKSKKSLFCLIQDGDLIQMHYFKNTCPRSKALQRRFLLEYFRDQIQPVR